MVHFLYGGIFLLLYCIYSCQCRPIASSVRLTRLSMFSPRSTVIGIVYLFHAGFLSVDYCMKGPRTPSKEHVYGLRTIPPNADPYVRERLLRFHESGTMLV